MSVVTMDDGVKIFYTDSGHGETLIFLHGLNSSHKVNHDFYNLFMEDYWVILYDQRGHGNSDKSNVHMNVRRLGKDLREIINFLNLDDVTLIGHSMGAATIYSYVNQYGCDKVKRIVASDMSPYMRNDSWGGGIGQGSWTDNDFMEDFERIFDDVGEAAFHISKKLMDPALDELSESGKYEMIERFRNATDSFTMASLWFSLFKTDQRHAISKVTVPFMYLMPTNPLYSMESVNYLKQNVQDVFVLENDFPNTSHALWRQMPHEVADAVKRFIEKY